MPEQIYIGNFSKGLVTSRLPFVIDNDTFPLMYNFYSWRGRAKRKRGTLLLGQLQIQLQAAASPNNWQVAKIGTLSGAGAYSGNLVSIYSFPSSASFVPGSFTLSDGTNTYTEPGTPNGTLVGAPAGTGTINYATGAITITGGAAAGDLVGTFSYYSGNPVMGLRDYAYNALVSVAPIATTYPNLVAFDTKKAYQIFQNSSSKTFYNVSYYKQSSNPVTWSGQDYQQFWTTSYEGALWATNNTPGFQFEVIATITAANPTVITTSAPHGLVTGDYVWFNEITGADASFLNGQTAAITKTGASTFTVAIDTATKTINNSGIFQTLTATSPTSTGDGIKWYDGDQTSHTGRPTSASLGWVNFAPPLTAATVSIDDENAGLYYLVGALSIISFKDRLLFFSPWIQTSSGAPIQLQDTVIWSWNGTPYYSSLRPTGESYDIRAYYVDQTGLGGYLSAGTAQPITTVSNNEDVLIIGFGGTGRKTRFVYTANDLQPFVFYNINSELPSDCTFSAVTLDKGAIDIGAYGIAMTDQQSSQRIDLDIPDSVFQIQALNNGVQRVNAIRDFFKEWVYFTYPTNGYPLYGDGASPKFPNQSFLFNYRDNTWAVLYENFTAHGTWRPTVKKSWLTLGYKSWNTWREAWNSGAASPLFSNVVAGNPQGYVLIKGQGTGEATSGTIKTIANSNGNTQITSINHCVCVANPNTGTGDYILFSGILGPTSYNGVIGKVISTPTADTFVVDIAYDATTYLGLGKFTRLSQPLLQTKQFNPYWEQGRQVRLSAQKYLMDYTVNGQLTVNLYLSQDPDAVWNTPQPIGKTSALVYSQLMYTCPESTNIGLTASNANLQMPTAEGQYQIWHRFNTSLIGDSVQVGFTLSDAQMKNLTYATSEIALHGMHLTVDRSSHLA